jgi:hypothetical protein
MASKIWFYLRNIFIHPVTANRAILHEKNLWPLILVSSFIGILPYWLIVLLGYQALGWDSFPYKQYYPYYQLQSSLLLKKFSDGYMVFQQEM